ncbi:MAG TPA: tetratricopeptide repeat protein [Bryobacteraceae bacterium]|nr:tetratricopeptide repeat protein [Bryobacteraceae bacterium]
MISQLFLLWQLSNPTDPAPLARLHEERIARFPADSVESRAARRDLGLFWLRNANPAEAERWLRQALPDAAILPYLAEAVAAQRRDAEAETLFGQCRALTRCLGRLADYAQRRGDISAALVLYRQAAASEPSPARRNDYGQALQAAGKLPAAEAQFRLAAAGPPASPETAAAWNNLASLLLSTGRTAEAETWQRKALASLEKTLGPIHLRTGLAASNLADILRARGQESGALILYRRALDVFEASLPPGHPWTAEARQALTAAK